MQTISSCVPPHLGPAVSEVTSIWFKLWLYSKLGTGPHSILLSRGTRLRRLPAVLKVVMSSLHHCDSRMFLLCQGYHRVLVTSWGHDPTSVYLSNLLLTVNDALTHSAVLIQVPHHNSYPHSPSLSLTLPRRPLDGGRMVKWSRSHSHSTEMRRSQFLTMIFSTILVCSGWRQNWTSHTPVATSL